MQPRLLEKSPCGLRNAKRALMRGVTGLVTASWAVLCRGHEAVLEAGPAVWGWDEDQCWTLARIAEVVHRRFTVDYTLAGLDLLLHRIGWSVQVLARNKRTAADLGAWLVFEDESGQGLRPPKGRTWGRRGHTPVVKVTGSSNKRVSLAALIAVKPGHRPRLIYRVHHARRRRNDPRKGFTDTGYALLLDA